MFEWLLPDLISLVNFGSDAAEAPPAVVMQPNWLCSKTQRGRTFSPSYRPTRLLGIKTALICQSAEEIFIFLPSGCCTLPEKTWVNQPGHQASFPSGFQVSLLLSASLTEGMFEFQQQEIEVIVMRFGHDGIDWKHTEVLFICFLLEMSARGVGPLQPGFSPTCCRCFIVRADYVKLSQRDLPLLCCISAESAQSPCTFPAS